MSRLQIQGWGSPQRPLLLPKAGRAPSVLQEPSAWFSYLPAFSPSFPISVLWLPLASANVAFECPSPSPLLFLFPFTWLPFSFRISLPATHKGRKKTSGGKGAEGQSGSPKRSDQTSFGCHGLGDKLPEQPGLGPITMVSWASSDCR